MSRLFRRTKLVVPYTYHQYIYTQQRTVSYFQSNRIISIVNVTNKYRGFCTSSKTPEDGQQISSLQESNNNISEHHDSPQMLTRDHLHRSFRRWTRWFTIRILMSVGIIVGIFWYCWDHPNEVYNLKTKISKIFSDVGTSTLNQKELQLQATEYSKQMIKDVFNDENMQQETKKFFIQILSQQDFLNTITKLLQELFQRDVMIESVKDLVINVFNDPSVIEQCKKLVGHAISAEENKQLLLETLHEIFDDPDVNDHARSVANDTVKNVLDDNEIKRLSAAFLQHVLNDDSVQQSSSDSLYKIFVGALTPNVFKKKQRKKHDEMEQHVPHHHIDVESMEIGKDIKQSIEEPIEEAMEQQTEQQDEIKEEEEAEQIKQEQVDEITDHANHIQSIIGNH